MRLLVSLFLLMFASVPAHANQNWTCQGKTFALPDGVTPFCTKAFVLSAICDGTDQVAVNEFLPWEPFPIVVTSISISFFTTMDVILNAQAGNGFAPDIMMLKGNGNGKEFQVIFPAGSGLPLPSSTTYTTGQWLDLHFGCTGYTTPPAHQVGFYLVGYRPFAPSP